MKNIRAALAGYDGPFFPERIDELNDLYGRNAGWSGEVLKSAARFVAGYQSQTSGTQTDDGYLWFWDIWFKNGESVIRLLFPWSDARIADERSEPHRSIAVYTKGELEPHAIECIISMLIKRFIFRLNVELPALERTEKR